MVVQTEMAGLWAVYGAAAGFLVVSAYMVWLKYQAVRSRRKVARVSEVLLEYFRKAGIEVTVECISLQRNNRFTAFVESEPMKQFRLSHMIEITLRDHVQKSCAVELDKIFWRFPIKVAARNGAAAEAAPGNSKAIDGADDYINEGLVNYRDLPKFEASEIPWESFEEAASQEPKKPDDIGDAI
jgi:hypothetical protein